MRIEGNERGFTLVEMLIVISLMSLMGLISVSSYRSFRERTTLNRAARLVAADASLTRSWAIQRRATVSMVFDEGARAYVIRASNGDTLARRSFDVTSEFALDTLDAVTAGDSLAFNARGLLTAGGTVEVDVGRASAIRQVEINSVGRSRVISP